MVTKPGEGFGFSIIGGVNGDPGNPYDETDEGIFVSQVMPGGAAARDGRLVEGTRILQVFIYLSISFIYLSDLFIYLSDLFIYQSCWLMYFVFFRLILPVLLVKLTKNV